MRPRVQRQSGSDRWRLANDFHRVKPRKAFRRGAEISTRGRVRSPDLNRNYRNLRDNESDQAPPINILQQT